MPAFDATQQVPFLKTPLPGPLAKALIENDERFTSPSYTRVYPLACSRGYGAVIEDVDGNRFLDFTAGIAVCSTGHCHPRVVAAIQEQAAKLLHMSGTDFYYAPQGDLAKKLAEIAPGNKPKRVFFTNSGAESVEAAFKLARHHTRRQHMIAFFGAFHGRTMGALSLTGSKVVQRSGFAPLIPQVSHVDYPNPYRHEKDHHESAVMESLNQIEYLFRRTVDPHEVAAIIVEPIQGEGGYIVPPPEFHRELKKLAEKHGILYIVDEVQTGMGRTGTWFGYQQTGVQPDVITMAKGIAAGVACGAMICRDEFAGDLRPGMHASTFGGNSLAMAAGLATGLTIEREGLLEHVEQLAADIRTQLEALQQRLPIIREIRVCGMMIGIELSIASAPAVAKCMERGVLINSTNDTVVRLLPALNVKADDLTEGLQVIADVLEEMANEA